MTSKNDPSKNINDEKLFKFPTNSYTFGKTPYWEFVAGVHNIFKFSHASDYVIVLNETDMSQTTGNVIAPRKP